MSMNDEQRARLKEWCMTNLNGGVLIGRTAGKGDGKWSARQIAEVTAILEREPRLTVTGAYPHGGGAFHGFLEVTCSGLEGDLLDVVGRLIDRDGSGYHMCSGREFFSHSARWLLKQDPSTLSEQEQEMVRQLKERGIGLDDLD